MKGFFLVLLCFAVTSCASVRFGEDASDYQRQLMELRAEVIKNPNNATALRDLGVILVRTSSYAQGHEYLTQAFVLQPRDPKTLAYLGLASESLGQREAALRLYEKYPEVPRTSPYRRLMIGRYEWIVRNLAQQQMRALAAREDSVAAGDAPVSARVVAVFPLQYLGSDARYEPLSRGISEMVMIDLANVPGLRVVERVRLQALQDELQLGQSRYVDPATAPRLGRLLGAGRVVGGNYNVIGRGNLQLELAHWDWQTAAAFQGQRMDDAVQNLFRMQKALVFELLNALQIELTAEQREKIERVPTQNLQAFLAYSRGLASEDAGAFSEAARHYGQAQQLDPNFQAATARADAAEGLAVASGTPEEALVVAGQLEVPLPGIDLMANRTAVLNASINASVVPGQDSRKPAQEASPFPAPPARPGNAP